MLGAEVGGHLHFVQDAQRCVDVGHGVVRRRDGRAEHFRVEVLERVGIPSGACVLEKLERVHGPSAVAPAVVAEDAVIVPLAVVRAEKRRFPAAVLLHKAGKLGPALLCERLGVVFLQVRLREPVWNVRADVLGGENIAVVSINDDPFLISRINAGDCAWEGSKRIAVRILNSDSESNKEDRGVYQSP